MGVKYEDYSGFWPFHTLAAPSPLTPPYQALAAAGPGQPCFDWWNLFSINVELSIDFDREWVFTDPDGTPPGAVGDTITWKLKVNGSVGALNIPLIPPGITLPGQRVVLPGLSGTGTFTQQLIGTYYVSAEDLGYPTGEPGTTTASFQPSFSFSYMPPVMKTTSGLYIPALTLSVGDAAAVPAPFYSLPGYGSPDLGGSAGLFDNITSPPINTGGDPSDTYGFTGGIPWANIGSISFNGASLAVYGYSGAYVPADASSGFPGAYIAGSDTLTVSGTITPVYTP